MKKISRIVVALCVLAVFATMVCAAAAPVVTVEETLDEETGVYTMTTSVVANPGINVFAMLLSYNTDVVTLFDSENFADVIDIRDTENCYTDELGENYYRDSNGLVVTAPKLSVAPTLYQFDTVEGRTGMYISTYTDKALKAVKNGELFSIKFVLASDKTLEDAEFKLEGLDSKFDKILGTSPTDPGMATNVYATDTAKATYYGTKDEMDVTLPAYFVGNEPEPVVATIAVAAGDIIYYADGTTVKVAEDNAAYELAVTEGVVVVNTGYNAQKVYNVADGVATEDTAKADGVLSTGEASIRGDKEETSGIRFKSTFLTALKDAVDEYGYLTTVESAKTGLAGTDYVLNMALFEAGKAVKAEAYIKGTDVDTFWNVEDDKTVVTAVVTNVPKTKEGVTTNIVIRPYYKVGEFVVYGEPMTRTVYEVALNIKENDAETYAKYQTYIDEIIALLVEEDKDVVIDFGPLFK